LSEENKQCISIRLSLPACGKIPVDKSTYHAL
jgi:hypothetical protein